MPRACSIVLPIAVLWLSACEQQPTKNYGNGSMERGRTIDPARPPALPSSPPSTPLAESQELPVVARDNDGSPDIGPVPLTGDAAKGEEGARNMLLAWARGIELRKFDQAWNLMGDAAKAQTSNAAFNAMFAPLRGITVSASPGTMEGAAGSSYYTSPVTIAGTRPDGTKAAIGGEVVLRRANDVPGATARQLAWHIEQLNLAPPVIAGRGCLAPPLR